MDGSSSAGGGEIEANRSSSGDMLLVVLLIAGGSDGCVLVFANAWGCHTGRATSCCAKVCPAARS